MNPRPATETFFYVPTDYTNCSVRLTPGVPVGNPQFFEVFGLCAQQTREARVGPPSPYLPVEAISHESPSASCESAPFLSEVVTIIEKSPIRTLTRPITGPNGEAGEIELIATECRVARPGSGSDPYLRPQAKCAYRTGRIVIPGLLDGDTRSANGYTLTVSTPVSNESVQFIGPPPSTYRLPAAAIPVNLVDALSRDLYFVAPNAAFEFPTFSLART
jgi:hypothetical protein